MITSLYLFLLGQIVTGTNLGQWTNCCQSKLSLPSVQPTPVTQPVDLHITILHCTSHPVGESPYSCNSESSDEHWNDRFPQQYMKTNIRVHPDGAYTLHFPWKKNYPPLPSYLAVCSKQIKSKTVWQHHNRTRNRRAITWASNWYCIIAKVYTISPNIQ